MKRLSWLESGPITWLGFFPWECAACRKKRFFHDDGRKPSERGHL